MKKILAILLALLSGCSGCSHETIKIPTLGPTTAATKQEQKQENPPADYVPRFSVAGPGLAVVFLEGPIDSESVRNLMMDIIFAVRAGATLVNVRINSPGGEFYSGFTLTRFFESAPFPIVCTVDGMAASMAAYVLQGCDVRIMTKRSRIMIHEPRLEAGGTRNELLSNAEDVKTLTEAMAEHIASRLKDVTPAQVLAKIAGGLEWWLGWKEAEQVGAVDLTVKSFREGLAVLVPIAATLLEAAKK